MTRDASRSPEAARNRAEFDLLAGLWEEAPFARLPADAPPELKELVVDIESPKRVYPIYKASRRHNFQWLVQKFIVQLRDGCGNPDCPTSTCFSCRKRIVGKAPIRRYNVTSARTIAIYLASQDNPENSLCPTLKPPKGPPAALDTLVISNKTGPHPRIRRRAPLPDIQHEASGGAPTKMAKDVGVAAMAKMAQEKKKSSLSNDRDIRDTESAPKYTVRERYTSKDYRSFPANMFGTAAIKMLEWLSPHGVESLVNDARSFEESHGLKPPAGPARSSSDTRRRRDGTTPSPKPSEISIGEKTVPDVVGDTPEPRDTILENRHDGSPASGVTGESEASGQRTAPTSRPPGSSRSSNARMRTSSSTKPKRKLSVESSIPIEGPGDEHFSGMRSPRFGASPIDKTPKTLKNPSVMPRPISQLTNIGFFDGVPLEKMPPPPHPDHSSHISDPARAHTRGYVDEHGVSSPASVSESSPSEEGAVTRSPPSIKQAANSTQEELFPQALSSIDADIVNFMCDVMQEDGTTEPHFFEPSKVGSSEVKFASSPKALTRRSCRKRHSVDAGRLKKEWRLFLEQSLFYVLSDAQALIRSFTQNGQFYDSQTLWYSMLRLTRTQPSLVLHSLWMAAELLFAPPEPVQALRSPTSRLFPKQDIVLSNAEAGRLMSICLHALIAIAPLVQEKGQLYEISRIRSHGVTLNRSGNRTSQEIELCLQYDEAFSNELAIRLARRLFTAITTRRYFDQMLAHQANVGGKLDDEQIEQPDVLAPLFAQLDFISMEPAYVLNFALPQRGIHENRVPTLLLDWARQVMIQEWDGQADLPGDGPLGGALILIEAIYNKRQALLLGDAYFRCSYFAERLDPVQVPVSWLSFTSTKKRLHLLDFPYIFNPSTVVTWFRSINFSRMSRAFEESNSLQLRVQRWTEAGSIVVDNHHKNIMQTLLKTATSKYLVLEISRSNVIKDAFDQLWRREERELMRPLKIHLGEDSGEEGFDSGGVQQEFFRLAMAEVLHPDYGAFTIDDRTRMAWFAPGSLEAEWKYELVGILLSLAVYNGLTLPITFPKALYRKLLGEPVTELHHIADGWPDLASGLTKLLEWDEKDGAVEDIFARTYEFSVEMYNQHVSREMDASDSWPRFQQHLWGYSSADEDKSSLHADNPTDAPLVTNENRNAYVSDYIRYLTDVSIRPQYEAFARGFTRCLHPKSLTLLNSSILQSVIEGTQHIDIKDLQRHARCIGWTQDHHTVRDFWSIVTKYDDAMKRRLLEFVTASDRVPVGGMKNVQFVLQKNGEQGEGGHLPTAYTCYGVLLLPEYTNKEVLRERLAMALDNAQGFGFA